MFYLCWRTIYKIKRFCAVWKPEKLSGYWNCWMELGAEQISLSAVLSRPTVSNITSNSE